MKKGKQVKMATESLPLQTRIVISDVATTLEDRLNHETFILAQEGATVEDIRIIAQPSDAEHARYLAYILYRPEHEEMRHE